MHVYRYLTGVDDAQFCHRVTAALNNGWELYGSPSLTYDVQQGAVICGQAIVKTADGADYVDGMDLASV